MSTTAKLKAKLLNLDHSFTWNELASLLRSLGYQQRQGSGSRVKFDNGDPMLLISLHRPHPGNQLKRYARLQVIEKLKEGDLL